MFAGGAFVDERGSPRLSGESYLKLNPNFLLGESGKYMQHTVKARKPTAKETRDFDAGKNVVMVRLQIGGEG